MSIRDDLHAKYASTSTAPASPAAAGAKPAAAGSSVRDALHAKYGTTKTPATATATIDQTQPSYSLDGKAYSASGDPVQPKPITGDGAVLQSQPVDNRKQDTVLSRIGRAVLPKAAEKLLGISEQQRKPAPISAADQTTLSGNAVTQKLMQDHPEAIDPLIYFGRGLAFGHDGGIGDKITSLTTGVQQDVTIPEPVTGKQSLFQALGTIFTMTVATPVIEAGVGGLVSQIPGGAAALEALKAKSITNPWTIGYAGTLAKATGVGALFGLITKNKKTVAQNVLETAGTFAAFTALAYPVQQFFKPIIESVATMKIDNPKLSSILNDPNVSGRPVADTLWFQNPKDPTTYLKVTANGVEFVPKGGTAIATGEVPTDVANLTSVDLEIFKSKPSLYDELVGWFKGERPAGSAPYIYAENLAVPPVDGQPVPGAEVPAGGPIAPTDAAPVTSSPIGAVEPVPAPVEAVLRAPAGSKTIDLIRQFSPDEAAAFGKRIIQRVNDELGTKIPEGANIPQGIKVNEFPSTDGRPAQFNNQGQIEVFLPNLFADLKTLSNGGTILAHDGAYSKVYKLQAGQNMEDLTVSYINDILIHEKAHEKTINLQDATQLRQLHQAVIEAQATGDATKITAAKTAEDKFAAVLEEKALAYEKANKDALQKELFGNRPLTATKLQKQINKSVAPPKPKPVTRSEAVLLKERLRAEARGAKSGLAAGKQAGAQAVRERIQNRDASIEDKRSFLADYAQAFLPVAERGQFLKAVKNTVSQKEFEDVLDRMQKASGTVERKGLIQNIMDELKNTRIKKKDGLPNVKFEIQAQRDLNRIRANAQGDYLAAQEQIAKLIEEWQTAHEDDVLPDEIVGEIQFLKMVGVTDMTAKELRAVLDDIKSIKETGKTLKALELFNRETEIQIARDKIIDIVTGGKPLPSAGQSLKQEPVPKRGQGITDFLTYHQWGIEELMDAFSKFDKGSKPYESFLSKYVAERLNNAYNLQNTGEGEAIAKINDAMKEVYGITGGKKFNDPKGNKELLEKIGDLQQMVDLGKVTHADGVDRQLTISRGQAMQMYMWQKDPTLAATFELGLNWGQAVLDTVDQFMKPEDKKMGDAMLAFYKEYYNGVNESFKKDFGIDMPFNENYSPVTRNVETLVPENVLLAQEIRQYATARNRNLKGRVPNNIELKPIDAMENVIRHIAKMEHYKAWQGSMFEFRRIFGNKQFRQAILDFHGKTGLKILDNFMDDFARDGVAREKIIRSVDAIRANATKALLGFNWRVGFKQLVGLLNYGIELPLKDFTTGVASFWTDPLKKSKFLQSNSPVLQERFGEGYERDIKFAIQKGYDKTLATTKSFSEWMFVIIRNADKFTVIQGSWAAYRSKYMEIKKGGGTDAEAKKAGIAYAEAITNRVQESSRPDTLSSVQRGGSLAKLFTMFQSQQAKYLRIMENAGRNYKYGRGSKATNVKRALWAWFIVPFIYNMVANQFIDKKYRYSKKATALETLLGPLQYPLIVGQMVQTIFGWVGGNNFSYSPSGAFSFMDDMQKAVTQLKQGDIIEATTYLADTMGKTLGVPTLLITKPLRKSLKDAKDTATAGAAAHF